MWKSYTRFASLALVLATLFVLAASATAQFPRPQHRFKFQYAAKFVCGANSQSRERVTPGFYTTAVNILNPNDRPIVLRKRIALTFPPREQRGGEVSAPLRDELKPYQALEVDCGEIPREFQINPGTPYVKGFLIVESRLSLDVTAVYTAGDLAEGSRVRSIDVEEIKERRMPIR